MGGAQVKQFRNDFICTAQKPDHSLFSQNTLTWQSKLSDDRYISSLTIPGTHQSISIEGGYAGVITVAQCQSWSLQDQLNSGIRAFDIRGKCKKGKFKAYHGIVDQKQDIAKLLPHFYNFLDNFPSEFIVMMIKEEDNKTKDSTITQVFDSIVTQQQKEKYWYMENKIPQIKDIRGKIFFIPRWRYGQGLKSYKSQDRYNVEVKKKVKHVEEFRKRTVLCDKIDIGEVLYINYLSGSTVKDWPLTYAKKSNSHIYQNHICRGIVMIDFPGEKLIDRLISVNFMSQQQIKDYINLKYLSKDKQDNALKISLQNPKQELQFIQLPQQNSKQSLSSGQLESNNNEINQNENENKEINEDDTNSSSSKKGPKIVNEKVQYVSSEIND